MQFVKSIFTGFLLVVPFLAMAQFDNNVWFNGTNARISIEPALPASNNAITIEAWIYAEQKTFDNSFSEIIRQDRSSGTIPDFLLSFQGSAGSNRILSFGLSTTSGYSELDVVFPFSDFLDTWNHVAAVFSSADSKMRLYVNGVERGSLTKTGTLSFLGSTGFTNVGSSYYGGVPLEFFGGNIDELRIWNRARSATDLLSTMNDTLPPVYYESSDSNLIGYWRFDETTEDVTNDLSVSQIHGTLINAIIGTGNPLPVELTSFSGFVSGNDVILNWETKSETNNYGWEIERMAVTLSSGSEGDAYRSATNAEPSRTSGSGLEWETVGFVSGKGTTNSPQTYTSRVTLHASLESFRLKQIDLDGTVSYSQILTIETNPTEFKLLGAYPNPFNPQTVIRYQLSEISTVKLTVYDITGRLVAELVNGQQNPGQYSVPFHATGLASGIYYFSLTNGYNRLNGQMIFLK